MSDPGPPFAFVVGAPRSGTTLLRAMLDSHPELAVPPEGHFVVEALRLGGDVDRLLGVLRRHEELAPWSLRTPVVAAVQTGSPWPGDGTVADALRAIYSSYAQARGKPRFADKTPSHARSIELLAHSFPESVFVHLVRDGRDVARSLLSSSFGPTRLLDAARTWAQVAAAARGAGQRLGARYVEVRYEELVADPEGELRRVCSALELLPHHAMLQYRSRTEEVLAEVTNRTDHPHLGAALELRRSWRRDVSPAVVAAMEREIGETLDAFGYELSGLRRGPRALALTAADRARVEIGARRARRARIRRDG